MWEVNIANVRFSSCSLISYWDWGLCLDACGMFCLYMCDGSCGLCASHMCFEWIRSMGGYVPCVLDVVFRYIGMFFVSLARSMPS